MKKIDKIIITAMTAVFTVAAPLVIAAEKGSATEQGEKCYGIVKAGLNDCATATESCAGSAKKNNQPDAFIFLPKGVCDKIVGGSLNSSEEKK